MLGPDGIVVAEERMLAKARNLMARLPLDEIDLLIIDEIGKEISGAGMDPTSLAATAAATPTRCSPKAWARRRFPASWSAISPLATNGNRIGIGMADFTTNRAVKALDLRYTYMNALTSIKLLSSKIPIHSTPIVKQFSKALPRWPPRTLKHCA